MKTMATKTHIRFSLGAGMLFQHPRALVLDEERYLQVSRAEAAWAKQVSPGWLRAFQGARVASATIAEAPQGITERDISKYPVPPYL